MKIVPIKTQNFIRKAMIVAPLMLMSSTTMPATSQPSKDMFELTSSNPQRLIPVHKSNDISPAVKVGKEVIYPAVVVDKSENKLYFYDMGGVLDSVFEVGLGKATTPTDTGLRVITGIEDYPYSNAPAKTLRHKSPEEYGPKVICLATVDTETGEITGSNGEFIHGTNKPESIGKNQSKGCIRLNNDDVKKLADWLFVGQYVLINE